MPPSPPHLLCRFRSERTSPCRETPCLPAVPCLRPLTFYIYPPISTLGAPLTIGAPQPDISPSRNAGRPPMNTVTLPLAKGVGGCGPATGGIAQACISPATAAG